MKRPEAPLLCLLKPCFPQQTLGRNHDNTHPSVLRSWPAGNVGAPISSIQVVSELWRPHRNPLTIVQDFENLAGLRDPAHSGAGRLALHTTLMATR
jgi:hypothetical protein